MRALITTGLLLAAYAYLAGLACWLGLQTFFPDRWWWLFLLSSLAVYLFLPLPLVGLVALLLRRFDLWLGFGAGLLVWGLLYGELFLPQISVARLAAETTRAEQPGEPPVLTVMSYNMLWFSNEPERVVAAIRAADADIVALQEVNAPALERFQAELGADYPYQAPELATGTAGMGILSRYPLRPTGQAEAFKGVWIGVPQTFDIDVAGRTVSLFNLHAISTNLGNGGPLRISPNHMEASIRAREEQMRMLAEVAAAHPHPLLVVGDFNVGDQSRAYAIITEVLQDAWRTAGSGFGHTFPGGLTPGGSRPSVAGIYLPQWLVRIDYIFYSPHWRATEAIIGPWDGRSDHRPVVARLVLGPDG